MNENGTGKKRQLCPARKGRTESLRPPVEGMSNRGNLNIKASIKQLSIEREQLTKEITAAYLTHTSYNPVE